MVEERDLYQSQRDEAIRERNAAASGQQEYGRVLDAVRDQLNGARGRLHTNRNVLARVQALPGAWRKSAEAGWNGPGELASAECADELDAALKGQV